MTTITRRGYTASCTCDWRQVRTDGNQRDRDAAEHVTPTSRQTP